MGGKVGNLKVKSQLASTENVVSEKKEKIQFVRSNNRQHGTGKVGNLKVKSQLASTENVVSDKKEKNQLVGSNNKQHGTGNAGDLKVKSQLASNVSISEKNEKNQLVRSNIKQDGTGNAGKLKAENQLPLTKNVEKEACTIDPNGPKLVILLSFGHSGQNEVWNIMGKFTGENGMKGFEEPGPDEPSFRVHPKDIIEQVAEKVAPYGEPKRWLMNYLCEQQKASPDAYFVGFKWKPRNYSTTAHKVLEAITSMDVPVKVIRLHRNYLDQIVSEEKAAIIKRLGLLEPRCQKVYGDFNPCQFLRKELGTKMHVHTNNLIARLHQRTTEEKRFENALQELNIPHMHAHFHKLLDQNDMGEWMRILEFLGMPKQVTVEERDDSMKLASLSINNLDKSISNMEFVRDTLKGSKYDYFIY